MKKKNLGIITLIVFIGLFFAFSPSQPEVKKVSDLGKLFNVSQWIPKAHAVDPAVSLANLTRMFFFMIVGYPSTTVYTALNGDDGPPQAGFIGMINSITNAVSAATSAGSCTDIPSTGSINASPDVVGEGAFDITATFGTPSRTIPTGYTGAGNTYEKKVTIYDAGDSTALMELQFNCATTAGYALFNFAEDSGNRKINLVYEMVNNAPRADFGMYYDTQDERMQMRLVGDADGAFTIDLVRDATTSGGSTKDGFRLHVKGNSVTEKLTVFFQQLDGYANMTALIADGDTALTSVTEDSPPAISTGYLLCIDFSGTLSATLNASCSGLTLSEPSTAPLFDPTNGAWTIAYPAGSNFTSSITDPS